MHLVASLPTLEASVQPGLWHSQDFSGPLLRKPLGPVSAALGVYEEGSVCVSQKSIPSHGEIGKQRMLSEVKAILALQLQSGFFVELFPVMTHGGWWVVYSAPQLVVFA